MIDWGVSYRNSTAVGLFTPNHGNVMGFQYLESGDFVYDISIQTPNLPPRVTRNMTG